MEKEPVKLKVIRSFRAEKQRREMRASMKAWAESLSKNPDLAGFVLLTIDSEGEAEVHYECGPVKPAVLPAYVQEALSRFVNDAGDGQEGVI